MFADFAISCSRRKGCGGELQGMEYRAANPSTIEELSRQNARLEQQVAELSAKLKWYEEQFRLAQKKRFGASSEKTHPDQMELNLFNEAEVLATPEGEEPPTEKITYERRKSQRQARSRAGSAARGDRDV